MGLLNMQCKELRLAIVAPRRTFFVRYLLLLCIMAKSDRDFGMWREEERVCECVWVWVSVSECEWVSEWVCVSVWVSVTFLPDSSPSLFSRSLQLTRLSPPSGVAMCCFICFSLSLLYLQVSVSAIHTHTHTHTHTHMADLYWSILHIDVEENLIFLIVGSAVAGGLLFYGYENEAKKSFMK